jgi:hypothetical protein
LLKGTGSPNKKEQKSRGSTTIDPSWSVKVTQVGKRKRFVVENGPVQQLLKLQFEGGKTTLIGWEKTHINWKSGVYSDENGVQHELTPLQLESLLYVSGDINRACVFIWIIHTKDSSLLIESETVCTQKWLATAKSPSFRLWSKRLFSWNETINECEIIAHRGLFWCKDSHDSLVVF